MLEWGDKLAMKKIHFALVGAGKMGTRWTGVLTKNKDISLDIIADTGSGKAKDLASQFPGVKATGNIKDVISNKEIDAVLIAVPHLYHASITSKSLIAGKHVLCEKPGAIHSIDIKHNIQLANKKKLTYMIGFNHRFHDAFLKARQLYQKGAIGKILFIRARYGFGGRVGYDKEWRINKKIGGGGELKDQGVHMIDLATSFIGKPDNVHGFIAKTFWGKANKDIGEDNGFVLLKAKDAIASIHVSLTQWKPKHNFEIYGDKGYLSIEGLGQRYGGDEKGNERLIFSKRTDDFDRDIQEKIIKVNPIADNSLALELKEFVTAIKKGRQPVPSAVNGYETLKIVEEVYRTNKS